MSFFIRTLLVLVLLALGGGSVFLATWDIPPPTAAVEKVMRCSTGAPMGE